MTEPRPTWYVVLVQDPTWTEAAAARFDGPLPNTPPHPSDSAPLLITQAARAAVPDIQTVFRLWGYIQTHPLPHLAALLQLLSGRP